MVDIEILGPLSVRCGTFPATPTAPKPRTLLALLALQVNEPVPVDVLIRELWGSTPPSTAKTTVQTYVMQIRRLITRALESAQPEGQRQARQKLLTMPGGYLLATESDRVDRWRFDRLATAGHRARERGDFEAASGQFADALRCWRGRALLDVQAGQCTRIEIQRLEEARLNALDCRIEADLRLGRYHELLAELAALVSQYPSHEGLAAHQMVALYRSGRRCDALAVYQRLHAALDELGLEPSPPLRRLHRTMLVCDRGSSELTDIWTATTAQGRRPGGAGAAAVPTQGSGRAGRIPAAVAAMSWQANGMTTGT